MVSFVITDIVVPLLSVGVAAFGLWYNGRANKKSQELSAMKEFDKEIRELELSPFRSKRYDQWGVDYLNEMNRIAYLANKRIIATPVALYYYDEFSSARGILALLEFNRCKGKFKDLEEFCQRARIPVGKAPLTYEEYMESRAKPCE